MNKYTKQHVIYLNYVLTALICFCYLCTFSSLIKLKPVFANTSNEIAEPTVDWDNVFNLRNDEDWRSAWHTEKHRRCYQYLLVHMEWVCEKDIYKLKRKRRNDEEGNHFMYFHLISSLILVDSDDVPSNGPFIPAKKAHSMVGKRLRIPKRRAIKRGIIDECCHGAAGCSWEEYAEYCPANRRMRV